ncbi:aldehyde dehydrogenase family protein [Pseudohalocynthiibacter aestuariivivens]|nr:aldehyde dehydrogenase family protein [Pseudohalocynthiibacter aestuariivivens]QIE46308.1 aldehyde dehydrogenase family protein [Pseudohalocynthiibacter aestuariivivens]
MSDQTTATAPLLKVPDRALSSAKMKVGRAAWAARYYQSFSREAVLRIAEAVARAGFEKADHYADWAVRETGFGVVEHKAIKNKLCTHELLDYYRELDLITPRVDADRKIVEMPKPAGVIFALAPATNPVATVYYKAMLAILSRNAIVFSPHPAAKACSADAARHLAEAAEAAGAPSGLIQCVEEPSVPLVQDIMASDKINVIMATGGNAMVRAAYSSGNPALGVGSGNAVAYVDPSARVDAAAKCLVDSNSFDNAILCTNESVVLCLQSNRGNLERALRSAGAHICNEQDTDKLRDYLFHDHGFNVDAVGKSAQWIAEKAGIRVSPSARILVPVVAEPGQDDLLFREKLCPVLTLTAAIDFQQAVTFAKHTAKRGAGHSAAFHGEDSGRLVAFSQAMPVYRVVVNAPCSQGAAGFATHLPPSFMIGTGYAGRSSVGENVGPQHLVNWTRIAYGKDVPANLHDLDFAALSADPGPGAPAPAAAAAAPANTGAVGRDELRQLILEELRSLTGNTQ